MNPILANDQQGVTCDHCDKDVPAAVRVSETAVAIDPEREAVVTVDLCYHCLNKARKLIKPSLWNRFLGLFLTRGCI